jgi:four helix bundle protein
MSGIQSHRDLIVWRKAMDLAVSVYDLAKQFPKTESFGLVAQITRAANSVPSNIAEGHARGSSRDYANFISIAKSSLMEAETLVMLAVKLNYLNQIQAHPALSLITEISKMLTALRNRLKSRG